MNMFGINSEELNKLVYKIRKQGIFLHLGKCFFCCKIIVS